MGDGRSESREWKSRRKDTWTRQKKEVKKQTRGKDGHFKVDENMTKEDGVGEEAEDLLLRENENDKE